jgi:alpha-aminoadipic semialdehyde synthase
MYWDETIPRFLTREHAKELSKTSETKLYSIADISCDINGGVEFTSKATTIDKPFFYYDAVNMKSSDKYSLENIPSVSINCLDQMQQQISK